MRLQRRLTVDQDKRKAEVAFVLRSMCVVSADHSRGHVGCGGCGLLKDPVSGARAANAASEGAGRVADAARKLAPMSSILERGVVLNSLQYFFYPKSSAFFAKFFRENTSIFLDALYFEQYHANWESAITQSCFIFWSSSL